MTLAIITRILVSILVGIIGSGVGIVLLMPAMMAWDSGNPSLIMKLISYASFAVIPITIIAAILSCIFGYIYLLIALLPVAIIAILFTTAMITGN